MTNSNFNLLVGFPVSGLLSSGYVIFLSGVALGVFIGLGIYFARKYHWLARLAPHSPVIDRTECLGKDIPHLLLVMADKKYRNYLVKAMSKDFRLSVLEDADCIIDICHSEEPDAIIIDETVNGIGGDELCLQVKNDKTTANIPVILLYRYYNEGSYLSHLGCGANCMKQRPVDITKFIVDIHMFVNSYIAMTEWIKSNPAEAIPQILYTKREADKKNSLSEDDLNFLKNTRKFWEAHLDSVKSSVTKTFYQEMHMSQSAFYARIKKITGGSLIDYRNLIRMEKASEYLISEDFSVTDIADKLGYCNEAYFRIKFKEYYNMCPTEYRNKYQKK